MSDNARIRSMAPGVTAEMIAEQIHLIYQPSTGAGTVAFQARESLFVGDAYEPLNGNFTVLEKNVQDIATRCFAYEGVTDPVTGVDLSKVSTGGVELILKAAYDKLFNEQAALIAAALAAQSGNTTA